MFVTFEGPDGSGKSTTMAVVAGALREKGLDVVETREPGGGPLGGAIRQLLLDSEHVPDLAEVFLFQADRAQNISEVIVPALQSGEIVLCDRHVDSTIVYQGHARGIDTKMLQELNAISTQGIEPDLTLLLDLPVEVGLRRVTKQDRLDRESLDFHNRVREGFLLEAGRNRDRIVVVDANATPENVANDCLHHIEAGLRRHTKQ